MREVETVQPLASPPTFGRTFHSTGLPTPGHDILFRRGAAHFRSSDHIVEVLDDPSAHCLVAFIRNGTGVLCQRRPAAGQAGEQQPV